MLCPRCGVEMVYLGKSHVRPDEDEYYHCLKCRHSYRHEYKIGKLVDLGREAV